MEDAGEVSSTSSHEAPVEMNGSVSQTPSSEDAKDLSDAQKVTMSHAEDSAPQTPETKQTPPAMQESLTQATEITSTSQITDTSSTGTASPLAEVTSTAQEREETITLEKTEVTQTTEVTSTTEVTITPQKPEVFVTSEETSPPQMSEGNPRLTEVTTTTQQATRSITTQPRAASVTPDSAVLDEPAVEASSSLAGETEAPSRVDVKSCDIISQEPQEKPSESHQPAPSYEPAPASAPESKPASAPESTPASAPESTPASAPESTPASAPESTPASAPESTPASAPESTPASAPESAPASALESTPASAPDSSPDFTLDSAPASFQPQFPSYLSDSPPTASQARNNLSMDSSSKDTTSMPGFDPAALSHSDDDLTFEMKNNSFQAFSPVNDMSESLGDRRSAEVSDNLSPDLVQNACDGDEDDAQPQFNLDTVSHSYVQQLSSSDLFSNVNNECDDRPTSLPDILKSSPLNPDKVDSGSSEGSPDFSPAHRSINDSPNSPFSMSATNPFGFDSKILLLKEMADDTEARAAEKTKLEAKEISEHSFAAFDLVKETDLPLKSADHLKDKDEAEMMSKPFVQMTDKFECLNFPTGNAQEHSDSESLSADSFSPVLDAVAHEGKSFHVEQDNRAVREETEATDEVSEQEASSEEFEFVERPPHGATDEFLEMQDRLKFMEPSEMLVDEDKSPELEQQSSDNIPATKEAKNQSSSHLPTQLSDESSTLRSKAGLESGFQEIHPASLIQSPVVKTETEKKEPEVSNMSCLSPGAVLELLYWRDVKTTGVVFGSSLFVLLSLTTCSIISVLSYVALALLSVTVSFRTYKGVLQAVQKSDDGHPFKQYLDTDIALTKELLQKYSDVALGRINSGIIELRRLFLVEDLVDSLKFAVFLWILTCVGALFNGLTLLILGLIGAFSCPIIYEKHQTQIDQHISMLNSQIKDILGKIQANVPGLKRKSE